MLLITMIWSGTFVIIKNALDDVPPFLYTALRFALATTLGYIIWFKHLRSITKSEIYQGSVLGFFFGIGFMTQTWGLQHTSVANSSFITGSMAIFTPIAAYLIDKKTISLLQAIGILTVLTGLGLFTQHGNEALVFNMGDMATLACAIMWGMYITYTDIFMRNAKDVPVISSRLTVVQFAVTGLLSLIGSLIFEGSISSVPSAIAKAMVSTDFLIAFLYTAIFASVVATYIQTRYQHETTPVKAALMFSTEPVAATLLAVSLGAEAISINKFLVGGIVIVGVLIAQAEDMFPRLRKSKT